MIILNEHERRLAAGFLQNGLRKKLIHLAIDLPMSWIEYRSREDGRLRRPGVEHAGDDRPGQPAGVTRRAVLSRDAAVPVGREVRRVVSAAVGPAGQWHVPERAGSRDHGALGGAKCGGAAVARPAAGLGEHCQRGARGAGHDVRRSVQPGRRARDETHPGGARSAAASDAESQNQSNSKETL